MEAILSMGFLCVSFVYSFLLMDNVENLKQAFMKCIKWAAKNGEPCGGEFKCAHCPPDSSHKLSGTDYCQPINLGIHHPGGPYKDLNGVWHCTSGGSTGKTISGSFDCDQCTMDPDLRCPLGGGDDKGINK